MTEEELNRIQHEDDRKYLISKIKEVNKIVEEISDYLKELKEAKPNQFTVVELTADELTNKISQAESDSERVHNERELTTTQFENAQQKASQYINMLARVMRTMNEISRGIIRNLV